ncbi:hypothetical protein EBZ38_16105 [bacterium]|nr:hypothetical protein [bacterium]NDD85784.1 hypothetical protein [bacterium]
MRKNDYVIYDKPYQLNIVGVRNAETQPNKFDDSIFVFYKDDNNNWIDKEYPATTDTGTYWLKNPMSNLGSAMLKEGQYVDAYKQGYHKGEYLALVQDKPVTTYRDYDRDAIFDIFTKETTGNYGINIHKAGQNSQDVDKWSAGCQVFQKSNDFADFMDLTTKHRNLYGNSFTYTLIDERAIQRRKRRTLMFVLFGLSIVTGSILLIKKFRNK